MGPAWFSPGIGCRVHPVASDLDPGVMVLLAEQAEEERFRRQREQLLLEEHGWAAGAEVTITAGIEAGMRHLVGRVGRVKRFAWRIMERPTAAFRLPSVTRSLRPIPYPACHGHSKGSHRSLQASVPLL
jgi:hypothetical protein